MQSTEKSLFHLVTKRLDAVPTLPLTLARIEVEATPDATPAHMTRIVQTDPALTARVLKVINSPFYGLRFKISTLSHAIAMLGIPALRLLARGIPAFEDEAGKRSSMEKARYWQHSLATAVAAREIAVEVGYDLPEEAHIGGLLHDIGKLVLDKYAPEEFGHHLLECKAKEGDVDIVLSERKHLGLDHAQVGALLAEQWNLPRILRDAIQLHHEPEERLAGLPKRNRELVGIVAAADRLCWAYGLGSIGSCRREEDQRIVFGDVALGPEQVDRIHREIEREFHETAERLGFAHEDGDSFHAGLRAAGSRAVKEPVESNGHVPMLSRLTSVGDVGRQARTLKTVEEMIESSLRQCRKGLGFDRLLFLQFEPEEEQLHGRYLFDDTHIEVEVHGITLPLNSDGLMGAAIRDRVSHRVDNWATDGDLLRYLGVVECVTSPVVVKERPLGLICADYFFTNREIRDEDVALMDILATELGLAIETRVLSRQTNKLRSLAAKDELTGINNRRNLMQILQKETDRALRYGSPLSVIMIDLDHFKLLNDTHGHQAGDTVLMEIAQLVVAASRDIDTIGRYGGEEFLVVLPETEINRAIVYAERLRATIEQYGDERKEYPGCSLTISVGVTTLLKSGDNIESIIRRVDRALYAAKDRGRNRVCVD